MTAFTQETKSQLAKLLATENIRIEHKKMPTAAFDPKNRVLYCPIWKNMSGYMYDLLMGHEVGHALYTPADGWHDASCANGKNFKSFLNVVEDARIEKKIKRKYPGLRSSFVTAYKELMQKDFFGIGGRDINKMSFINRLNIYTKSDYTANIQFGAKEKELVDRVRAVESWEDVIKITGEVFAYAKEEQEENEDLQWQFPVSSGFGDDEDEGDDYGDSSDFGDEIPGQDGNNSDSSEDSGEEGDQDGTTKSDSEEKTKDGDVDEFGDEINHEKYSEEYDGVMGEPTCETDDNFRRREVELLDDKSKDYVYVSFPTPNLEKIVTPAARVHELITNHYQNDYSEGNYFETKLTQLCDEFKKKNEKYVSLLAKEFEMRKAASKFSKAKIATTGDIDISRLYKYQVDDNIFRKTMKMPKGKSHGLVMMFDRSGSMNENMKGSIEQMLVIAMFCRKVNIPFVVYGFGNNIQGRAIDFPGETYKRFEMFSKGVNELAIGGVFLREYMNSKMSNAEFSKVFRNMVALMNSYGSWRNNSREFSMPLSEDLSNTPMNEAFIALEPVTQQFRKVNNLDIVNTVLIHDGDSDWFRGHFFVNPENNNGISTRSYYVNQENVFVVDKKLKKEFRLTSDDDMQRLVMDWYTAKTGSKIFGFFIGGSTHGYMKNMIWNGYVNEKGEGFTRPTNWEEKVVVDEKIKSLVKIMKKEKFLTSYKKGYNKFFLIAGGKELEINDGDFEFESESEKVNAKKLATAFMRFNEKRQVNRVLVQKFIEGIAI
jgi:hypothetical protein